MLLLWYRGPLVVLQLHLAHAQTLTANAKQPVLHQCCQVELTCCTSQMVLSRMQTRVEPHVHVSTTCDSPTAHTSGCGACAAGAGFVNTPAWQLASQEADAPCTA
jgi:hypothetical protein